MFFHLLACSGLSQAGRQKEMLISTCRDHPVLLTHLPVTGPVLLVPMKAIAYLLKTKKPKTVAIFLVP